MYMPLTPLQLLESILPYTERHLQRIDLLLQKSFLIDYTLERMDTLLPEDEEITEAPEQKSPNILTWYDEDKEEQEGQQERTVEIQEVEEVVDDMLQDGEQEEPTPKKKRKLNGQTKKKGSAHKRKRDQ